MGAGLGELDAEDAMAVSFGSDGCLRAVCGRAVKEVRLRGWFNGLGADARASELLGLLPAELPGDGGTYEGGAGEDDNEPALKGWNETEVRLWYPWPSVERSDDFEPCAVRWLGGSFEGGDSVGDDEGMSRTARKADNGLVPGGGPALWKVDMLP